MLLFQTLLWLLLLVPFIGAILGLLAAAGAYVAVLAVLCYRASLFKPTQREVALLLAGVYALASLLLMLSVFYNVPLFVSLGAAVIAWLALFLFLRRYHGFMEGEVVGYDNGFAIVRIEPSLVSWVPAGAYAVASKRVKAGKRVRVRFDWLTRKGFVE